MIWIIGGTSEARTIVNRIQDLDNFIVSIASQEGQEFLDTENIHIGRMDFRAMVNFIEAYDISLIVDLSHPYAKIVSDNCKKAAKIKTIPYIRYERDKVEKMEGVLYLSSYRECYDYLSGIKGTVLFTTGSKNIGDFERIRGHNRFIYRVLPSRASMDICAQNHVSMKDIVALLGPFSKEFNMIMLSEYKADYCVMKDSGQRGGTLEKIEACLELSIHPIIIGRDYGEGMHDIDRVEELIRDFI